MHQYVQYTRYENNIENQTKTLAQQTRRVYYVIFA